jgi:hypothetical protein
MHCAICKREVSKDEPVYRARVGYSDGVASAARASFRPAPNARKSHLRARDGYSKEIGTRRSRACRDCLVDAAPVYALPQLRFAAIAAP